MNKSCCKLAFIKQLKKDWSSKDWRQLSFGLIVLSFGLSMGITALFLAVRSHHIGYLLEACSAPDPELVTILSDYNGRPKVRDHCYDQRLPPMSSFNFR